MPKYIEITEDEAWAIDHTIRHTYAEGPNIIGRDLLLKVMTLVLEFEERRGKPLAPQVLPLALTEDEPTIKPYMEDRWAKLDDVQSTPLDVSLALLDNLHKRWVRVLRSIKPDEWKRTFRHPELGTVSLEKNLALYAWHGRHHVAHITELRKRMGW